MEMSIVLIVIGLIIGSIIAGSELIDAATIHAQISQITKFHTAVHIFKNKYGSLPGDMLKTDASNFGFQTGGGACDGSIAGSRDNNGVIEPTYGSWLQGQGEVGLFWEDLSSAGLIDQTFPNNGGSLIKCTPALDLTLAPGSGYIGDNFPSAKMGNNNFVYVYANNSQDWYGVSAITSNVADGGMFSNASISVIDAYRVDSKIDDGTPDSGTVQDMMVNNYALRTPNAKTSDSATSCYNKNTHTYSVSINGGSNINCALSFEFQ